MLRFEMLVMFLVQNFNQILTDKKTVINHLFKMLYQLINR